MSTNQTSPNRVECELAELEKLHLSERGESTAGAGPLDEDELDRFRNQWKTEVQAKRQREASAWRVTQNEGDLPQQADASRPGDNPSETSTASLQVSPAKASRPLAVELDEPPEAGPSRRHPATGPIKRPAKPAVRSTNGKEDAVQLYGKAVEKEQSGQLSEALMLYRKAFKLDGEAFATFGRHSLMRFALKILLIACILEASQQQRTTTPTKNRPNNPQPLPPMSYPHPRPPMSPTPSNAISSFSQTTKRLPRCNSPPKSMPGLPLLRLC